MYALLSKKHCALTLISPVAVCDIVVGTLVGGLVHTHTHTLMFLIEIGYRDNHPLHPGLVVAAGGAQLPSLLSLNAFMLLLLLH
jgi:hypothetical protein